MQVGKIKAKTCIHVLADVYARFSAGGVKGYRQGGGEGTLGRQRSGRGV